MKKIFSYLFLSLLLVVCLSCKKESVKYNVILPSGTPLVSVGGLLDNEKFNFEIVNGSDPLTNAFIKNNYDIIIAPMNLGAKLYLSKQSGYQLYSIITINNTYIISRNDFSINDLKDETIVSYGVNSSPWIALSSLNDEYELNMTLINQNSASDVSTLFVGASNDYKYYLSAEPNISTLKNKLKDTIYSLDLSDYLDSDIIQACIFVNPNSKINSKELDLFEENINKLNGETSDYVKEIINKNDFFKNLGEKVLTESIPKSNIVFLKASDNIELINNFYNLLNKYTPKILNGNTPDEKFIY